MNIRRFILFSAIAMLCSCAGRTAKPVEITMETTMGTIELKLYDETPLHRDNFKSLALEGAFDSLLFHRVIKDFMIQGGDPDSKHAEPGVLLGDGDKPYTVPAEFRLEQGIYHRRGVLAAAREGNDVNPEMSSSAMQFYIVWGKIFDDEGIKEQQARLDERTGGKVKLTPEMIETYKTVGGTPHLDGQYTVFGEVTKGLEVVDAIQNVATDGNDRPLENVRILKVSVKGAKAQSDAKTSTRFLKDGEMPVKPEFPEIPAPKPIGSVKLGDINAFQEVKLDIPIAEGPCLPSWESVEQNYSRDVEWLREAKVGFWVHFGPQASGESGDWYARNLYKEQEDHIAYHNHLERFGHPSEVGYKEVLRDWNPSKFDPEYITELYQRAGARFLMIQGVHHDNFDMWNSQYHPWNSVNMGPKRDMLREWVDACNKYGMHYGVTFHHEYTWWWWQTAFGADTRGPKKGVPYDGNLTLADGKGKWWEGYDPRLLYGVDLREYETVDQRAHRPFEVPDPGIFVNHLDYAKWFATQWALRIMDVVENYSPDFIYTDGTSEGPFCGTGTGTGFKCNAMPIVMADYYNRTLKKTGKADIFSIIKFRSPTNGAVNTAEFDFSDEIITSQPWIREAPIGDWFYAPGFTYDSGMLIRFIIEAIARDGNVAVNIPMRPDGSIADECVAMLEEMGDWMKINSVGIYGSKAWKTLGEGEIVDGKLKKLPGGKLDEHHKNFKFDAQDIRFTEGKNGHVYAFCMNVPEAGQTLRIKSMGKNSGNMGKVKSVSLLGFDGKISWKQEADALEITFPMGTDFKTSVVFEVE